MYLTNILLCTTGGYYFAAAPALGRLTMGEEGSSLLGLLRHRSPGSEDGSVYSSSGGPSGGERTSAWRRNLRTVSPTSGDESPNSLHLSPTAAHPDASPSSPNMASPSSRNMASPSSPVTSLAEVTSASSRRVASSRNRRAGQRKASSKSTKLDVTKRQGSSRDASNTNTAGY